jgi:hypothetical protein
MGYVLRCECGELLSVSDGMAGTQKACPCGRTIAVPALGELRRSAMPDVRKSPAASSASGPAWIVQAVVLGSVTAIVLALAVVFGSFAVPGLGLLLVGRFWMLAVGFRTNSGLGCLLLLFPEIMMLMFLVNNPKLALPPFLCWLVGAVLLLGGLSLRH